MCENTVQRQISEPNKDSEEEAGKKLHYDFLNHVC